MYLSLFPVLHCQHKVEIGFIILHVNRYVALDVLRTRVELKSFTTYHFSLICKALLEHSIDKHACQGACSIPVRQKVMMV